MAKDQIYGYLTDGFGSYGYPVVHADVKAENTHTSLNIDMSEVVRGHVYEDGNYDQFEYRSYKGAAKFLTDDLGFTDNPATDMVGTPKSLIKVSGNPNVGVVQGTVQIDENRNGVADVGEVGVGGVKINIYQASTNSLLDTTITNPDGSYSFEMLMSQPLNIEFVNPSESSNIMRFVQPAIGGSDANIVAENIVPGTAEAATVVKALLQKPFTVTFDTADGWAEIPSQPVYVGNVASKPDVVPQKENYTFSHWYNAQTGIAWSFDTIISEDMVLRAEYIGNSYDITFNMAENQRRWADGSNAEQIKTVTMPNHTLAGAMPLAPTKASHPFVGWFTSAKEGALFTEDTPITENMVVYAQWVDRSVYAVVFDGNGADVQASPQCLDIQRPEIMLNSLSTAPKRTGYSFVGWNTAKDGSGAAFDAQTYIASNVTVYAQWTAEEYLLSFYQNDESGKTVSTQQVAYGERAKEVSNPKREGYTFAGWNTAADGSGSMWSFGTNVMPADDVNLYAQWISSGPSTLGTPSGPSTLDLSTDRLTP